MNLRSLFARLLTLLLALGIAEQAAAQATISYALLSGTITDESGQLIPKANVTLRSLDTNQTFSATSNVAGYYALPNLPPGRYELTVTSSGFGTHTRT
jgi:Carboxypeptidase regulatory-like domain